MNHHTTTRIPVNDEYAALLGKAVYIFLYYEWIIIWIIEVLEPGFLQEYSRQKTMTSGEIKDKFKKTINVSSSYINEITKEELQKRLNQFSELVLKRNALIHAHPATDTDGSQMLCYQGQPSKPPSDIKWTSSEVKKLITAIDKAGCEANSLFDRLRKMQSNKQL